MPSSNPPLPRRLERLQQGRDFVFIVMTSVAMTLLYLACIAVACQLLIPPIRQTPEFQSQFTVPAGFLFPGQPAKTAAYELAYLTSLFVLWAGICAARRLVTTLPDRVIGRLIWIGVGVYFLLLAACAWPMIYCPHPPFPMIPPSWLLLPFDFSHPLCTPARILFLLAAVGIGFCFLRSASTSQNANRALMVLLALWLVLIPSRIYSPAEINDELRFLYPLDAVLDSLSQSVNGHHLLIDYPHIYGGYGELLAPFIRLFPAGIGTLMVALAVPNVIGMLCLLLTARLVVRQPVLLFLCGLSLLGVGYLSTAHDIDYGYVTARCFFPPIGLLTATLYFRRTTTPRYIATTAVAAIASIWNLDTGLVLWASWLGTLAITALARRDFVGATRHLALQTLLLLAAWIAFFLYLRIVSSQWPDGSMLFYFQRLVVSSGYFCLGLIFPDMWVAVVILYVISLAIVLLACLRRKINRLTPAMIMISLLGIGTFSYFMGRSAESNLVGVSYPAILLCGILCAEGEIVARLSTLTTSVRYFLLPAKMTLFWWSFLLVAALPDLLQTSGDVLCHWESSAPTPLESNIAFIRQRIQPRETGVFFLSNDSGIYYYLSGTVRPLKIPGMIELLQTRDMNVLIDAIRQRRIAKLFVEQNFYDIEMYRLDVYDAIRSAITENYAPAVTAPTGRLILYTPR